MDISYDNIDNSVKSLEVLIQKSEKIAKKGKIFRKKVRKGIVKEASF